MTILPTGEPATWTLAQINELIINVTQLALTVAGIIAMLYIVIGGYYYFTAFGNEEKATKAKSIITWAVIGVVVIILSKIIITEIWNLVSTQPPDFPI